jgi:hypothetical protein
MVTGQNHDLKYFHFIYYKRFYEKITPNNFQNNIFLKKLLKPFEWCVNYDKM